MKKILILLLGVMISATAGMTLALATNDDLTFLDEVLDSVDDFNGNYDGTADELEKLADADEGELPFQNLYLYMYQNVVEGPKKEAIKEIAKRTSYTSNQLEKIIFEGNIEAIVNREDKKNAASAAAETDIETLLAGSELSGNVENFVRGYYYFYLSEDGPGRVTEEEILTDAMTQEEAMEEYTYLKDLYQDEYAFQSENRRLLYEAMAAEMFINGDTGDSAGIDLLYDLNLINSVIFGKVVDYPDRGGTNDAVILASIMEEFDEIGNNIFLASEDDDASGITASGSDDANLIVLASDSDGSDEDSFSTASCDEDSDLRAALDTFENSDGNESESSDSDVGVGSESSDSGTGSSSSSSSTSSTTDSSSSESSEDESDAVEEFNSIISSISGSPGDWSRSLPCNEIFCITVNLVKENDDAEVADYEKTDNCIACHTQYINERMDETLSKSLTPSKVSMNYFEDATCKDGTSFTVGLNIFTRWLPIVLSKGDDTDEAAGEAAGNFVEGYLQESGLSDPDALTGKSKADSACEAALSQANLSGGSTDLTDAMQKCNPAVINSAIADRVEKFVYLSEVESDFSIYEQMSSELYSMLLYFDGMRTALAESFEPINSLVGKKYCE